MENNKKILTADIIIGNVARSKKSTGILICVLAVVAFVLVLTGVFAPFGLVLGGVLLYFGIRNINTSKKNLAKLQARNYRVIKTRCTEYSNDSDGEGECHVTIFENGGYVVTNSPIGAVGDIFYLVYLDGAKKPNAYYSEKEYQPDGRLIIEEYQPPVRQNM